MKQATVTVRQYPYDAENVLVNVLDDDGETAIVKAVKGFPFTDGGGDSILSGDLWWYNETKVRSAALRYDYAGECYCDPRNPDAPACENCRERNAEKEVPF